MITAVFFAYFFIEKTKYSEGKRKRMCSVMKMTNKQYNEYVKKVSPKSPVGMNMLKAFISGGIICCIGQAILNGYLSTGLSESLAGTATSITLIFAGALLTGLKVYDNIAKFSGAGSLVPITVFVFFVVSPALEFKAEGVITGTAAKMFVIAGPVIVFGTVASVIYGIILVVFNLV